MRSPYIYIFKNVKFILSAFTQRRDFVFIPFLFILVKKAQRRIAEFPTYYINLDSYKVFAISYIESMS